MGERVGFLPVDNIVGHRRNIGGMLGSRHKALKGTKTHEGRTVERGRREVNLGEAKRQCLEKWLCDTKFLLQGTLFITK